MSESVGNRAVASTADRLWELWRKGGRPDLDAFLAKAGSFEPGELSAIVRIDQAERWGIGAPVPAEEYLERYPAIAQHPESALDLIHNEYLLAERHGREPDADEFVRRFPAFAESLRLQIALHNAVGAEPTRTVAVDQSRSTDRTRSTQTGMNELTIERLGRYRIVSLLGRGGMGAVYEAHDEELDRRVALKIPNFSRDDSASRQRFRREARIAANLRHPNLCPVHDVGEVDGALYMTMPVIEGESLAARLKRLGRLSSREAIRLIATVARAVGVAHRAGVVHRDLKPANIMLGADDEPVVMDFGLASRSTVTEQGLTDSGVFIGTPAYAAPEQIANVAGATPQADVYALGAILVECLTGAPPFAGTASELLRRKIVADPEPPSRRTPSIGRDLDAACLKAIARSPAQRYLTSDEFANALEGCAADGGDRRPTRRRWLLAAAAGAIVVAVGVGIAMWPKSKTIVTTPASDKPSATASPAELLIVQSIWHGKFSFDPNDPQGWGPALLWITRRDGSSFRGLAETENGEYAWIVDGTTDGEQIRWNYVEIVREKMPTQSVENGANVQGRINGASIEVTYRDPGDRHEARIILRQVERDPAAAQAHVDLAWRFNDSNKEHFAIQVCDVALRLDDRNVSAYICRANANIKKRKFSTAIVDLDKAIEIDAKSHIAYVDRAWAESSMGKFTKALTNANKAIELRPDAAEGYYQRGAAYAGSKKYFEALMDFTVAIEKKPDYAWAYFERGKAHRAVGYQEMAEEDFAMARKLDKSLPKPDQEH